MKQTERNLLDFRFGKIQGEQARAGGVRVRATQSGDPQRVGIRMTLSCRSMAHAVAGGAEGAAATAASGPGPSRTLPLPRAAF